MNKKILITLIGSLAFVSGANAELISTDVYGNNDNLATLDTETGIEWLDLSQTLGMSYVSVSGNLETAFLGWRFPTNQEVNDMIAHAFPSSSNLSSSNWTSASSGDVSEFKNLFMNNSSIDIAEGFYIEEARGEVELAGVRNSTSVAGLNTNWGYNATSAYSYRGVYLVSDGGITLSSINNPSLNASNPDAPANNVSSVPLKASISLMALGLAGFFKKKK
jgi:hypothetical protein